MGKIVEKRKKKKKGRPSLLDLQKRSIKQQQQHQLQNQKPNLSFSNSNNSPLPSSLNYKSATHPPVRRSTRRNPTPSSPQSYPHPHDDAVQFNGRRREKKLQLVLKLPSSQKLDPNSPFLNSSASDFDGDDDEHSASYHRKRKINAITDESGLGVSDKGENSVSGANPSNNEQDLGPSMPLPDKKLLLFILDRLQKKDTYGVFSEPVGPNELPDYHEVIAHPMDFGTVRKKLSSGIYTSLEQFEKDVLLICSNAMQYNAPDTIYFRQARSIQELAKKNFENLRQDSDDNEPEPKVVRRGRPPTKNFKKPLGRPLLDRAGSEFSLDATLSSGGQSTLPSNNDWRKGPIVSDKSGFADSSVRSHGSGNDAYWLANNKFERNDEATGSIFKGNSIKNGKRQFVLDENRRNTYKQLLAAGREPSVLATFDAERKQLMAVGLLSEYGYAWSLARFAANIGSVAWKIASTRIEQSLPPRVKFGHGWVGENDIPPQRALLLSSSPSVMLSSSKPLRLPENSRASVTSSIVEPKEELSEIPENNMKEGGMHTIQSAAKGQLSNVLSLSASAYTSPVVSNKSEPRPESAETVEGLNSQGGYNMHNANTSRIRPRPPLQIHQSRIVRPVTNGLNGTYGVHLLAQMGKLVGAARPAGLNIQSSQINSVSRINTGVVNPAAVNSLNSVNLKFSDNSSDKPPNSGNDEMKPVRPGLEPQTSQPGLSPQPKLDSGLSPQQKPDSVPPDLNIRFQSPSSPSSNRVDSAQPDLALQL